MAVAAATIQYVFLARIALVVVATSGCRLGFDSLAGSCEDDPFLCVDAAPPIISVDAASAPDAAPSIVPIDSDVAPQIVSGAETCTSGTANLNRDVGIDAKNAIYVVFECGGLLTAVVSEDAGLSYSLQVDLGIAGVDSIAVAGGGEGVVYVAAATATTVEFLKSTDTGQTWTSSTVGTVTGEANWGVSLAIAGDSIYVARKDVDMRVFANHTQGEGAFTFVDVAMPNTFGDILADPITGDVFAVTDTPEFHIRRSIDGGLTFEAEASPPGAYHYSDWTLADSTLYVVGQETSFTRIPLSDLASSVITPANLNSALPQSRAIAAAADGSIFTSQVDSATSKPSISYFPSGTDVATDFALPTGGAGISLLSASSSTVVYVYTTPALEVAVGIEAF
jgi:hypothetical protein